MIESKITCSFCGKWNVTPEHVMGHWDRINIGGIPTEVRVGMQIRAETYPEALDLQREIWGVGHRAEIHVAYGVGYVVTVTQ